jgi:hypothetical protein
MVDAVHCSQLHRPKAGSAATQVWNEGAINQTAVVRLLGGSPSYEISLCNSEFRACTEVSGDSLGGGAITLETSFDNTTQYKYLLSAYGVQGPLLGSCMAHTVL